jgi:hypothetical protein
MGLGSDTLVALLTRLKPSDLANFQSDLAGKKYQNFTNEVTEVKCV